MPRRRTSRTSLPAAVCVALIAPGPGSQAVTFPAPQDLTLNFHPDLGLLVVALIAAGLLMSRWRRRSQRQSVSPSSSGQVALRAIRLDSAGIESVLREQRPGIDGLDSNSQATPPRLPVVEPARPSKTAFREAAPVAPQPGLRMAGPPKPSPAKAKPTPLVVDRPAFQLVDRVYRLGTSQVGDLLEAIYRKEGFALMRPDGGRSDRRIDLVADKDGERLAIQYRHWGEGRVGTAAVQELGEAMRAESVARGILFSLKGCTFEARGVAQQFGIRILDKPDILQRLEEVQATTDPDLVRHLEVEGAPTRV